MTNCHGLHLWREVESQVAVVAETVLNKKWDLVAEAELDRPTKTRSLAEVQEVLERKGEGDGLGEVDFDVLVWLVDVGVRAKRDGAVANVASALEADTVLCTLDGDCRIISTLSFPMVSSLNLILPDSLSAVKSLVMR